MASPTQPQSAIHVESSAGRFVQLGHQPTSSGPAADGFGTFVTIGDLERREREKVRERLEQLRPELIAKGVEVMRAKLAADAAAELFRKELHAAVGGDGVVHGMALIKEQLDRQAAAEVAKVAAAPVKK